MDIWVIRGVEDTGIIRRVVSAEKDKFSPGIAKVWNEGEGYSYYHPGEWFESYDGADKAARSILDKAKKRLDRKQLKLRKATQIFYKKFKERNK